MAKVTRVRRKALAVAAAAAVPLIAIPAGGMPGASAEPFNYFPTEPTRVLTLSLLPGGNDDDLSGVMCQTPRTCQNVPYSRASSSAAVSTLNKALRDGTTGKQIVFAYSQGARVVGRWILENEGAEGAPTAQDLSFVLMGNPARKYGGSDRDWETTFPESDYHVIDVSQQYDMASDFPDNPFNLLALLNANAGFFITHQNYETVDIYDEANYVWTEGNITYVFVPTENLPLLEPLRWLGLSALADALNTPLKEIIEKAYDRSYLPAAPGLPTTPAPEPEEPQEELGAQDPTVQSVSYAGASSQKSSLIDDETVEEAGGDALVDGGDATDASGDTGSADDEGGSTDTPDVVDEADLDTGEADLDTGESVDETTDDTAAAGEEDSAQNEDAAQTEDSAPSGSSNDGGDSGDE